MRKLLLSLALFGACGILRPTLQPFGCDGEWMCQCEAGGDCDWVLVCKD